MKLLAIIALLTSFAYAPSVRAQDERQPVQHARADAAPVRPAAQHPLPPHRFTPAPQGQRPGLNQPHPWQRNPIGRPTNNQTPQLRRTTPASPTGVTPSEAAAVPAAPQTTGNPTGDWRNRVAGTPRNPDWRNRHQTDGLHDWRNHQNDANIDWHNRTGSGNRDWRDHGGGHGGWHHDWDRHSHHCDWWRSRYSRFAFFGGGYYYWDAGFWYPAYGYDPSYTTYAYDAPIYGYNDQSPADVMVSVQQELARRGFYYGAIDGTYGPLTRSALLNYQQSVGLASTGVLDQPTLASLGFD